MTRDDDGIADVTTAEGSEHLPPPAGRRRWLIFWCMLVVGTLSYIDRSSLSVGMPLISKEFGLSAEFQGVLISMFFWTYTLFLVPAGWLADRFGPRSILAVVLTAWAVIQLTTGLVHTITLLVTLRLLLGLFEAAFYPAAAKLSAAWLPEADRGRGAALADSASALGGALGGLFVGGLIDVFGDWREAFVIVGAVTTVSGLAVYWIVRNSPEEDPKVSAAERRYIDASLAVEDARSEADDGSARTVDFVRFRNFWLVGIGFFAGNIVFYGLLTYGPIYLSESRGLDIKSLTWATFTIYFSGFVGENLAGWITQTWQRHGASVNRVMRTLTGVSAAISTVAILGVAAVKSNGSAIALLAVTLFFLRFLGLYWSLPAALAGRSRAGVFGGMMNVFSNVGGILAPLVIGFIVGRTGSYFLGLMFFAASAAVYCVCSLLINWSERLPIGRRTGMEVPA